MSIAVYTGKPGSGKTYRVVKELLEDEGRYYVFHNIDGLKESLIEGGRYIQNWTSIENFFTKEKQEEISSWARSEYNRSVLVIVDEAQTWFGDRSAKIKAWLTQHRKLGQDIMLAKAPNTKTANVFQPENMANEPILVESQTPNAARIFPINHPFP